MSLLSEPGEKIVFSFPNNGYEGDRNQAKRCLVEGQTYTIQRIEMHGSHTDVYLKELPDEEGFNSVLFSNAPKSSAQCTDCLATADTTGQIQHKPGCSVGMYP